MEAESTSGNESEMAELMANTQVAMQGRRSLFFFASLERC